MSHNPHTHAWPGGPSWGEIALMEDQRRQAQDAAARIASDEAAFAREQYERRCRRRVALLVEPNLSSISPLRADTELPL
jgi:hypothetical protein